MQHGEIVRNQVLTEFDTELNRRRATTRVCLLSNESGPAAGGARSAQSVTAGES